MVFITFGFSFGENIKNKVSARFYEIPYFL